MLAFATIPSTVLKSSLLVLPVVRGYLNTAVGPGSRSILINSHRNLHTSQALAMADSSKAKSDAEWRAILSPEQVRT